MVRNDPGQPLALHQPLTDLGPHGRRYFGRGEVVERADAQRQGEVELALLAPVEAKKSSAASGTGRAW